MQFYGASITTGLRLSTSDAAGDMVLNYEDSEGYRQIKFITLSDFDCKAQLATVRCNHDEHPVYYGLWEDALAKVQEAMDSPWAQRSPKFMKSLTLHFIELVAALWDHAEATPEFNNVVAVALPQWPEDNASFPM